jgi:hypothetical protein
MGSLQFAIVGHMRLAATHGVVGAVGLGGHSPAS